MMSRLKSPNINMAELEKIIQMPHLTKEVKIIQLRDRAILEILYSTGLKVSELSTLTNQQIDFENGLIIIENKNRIKKVILTNQAVYYLKQYMTAKNDESTILFIRYDRAKTNMTPSEVKPLTPRSIQRLVEKYGKKSGILEKITPGSFRQNFAIRLFAMENKLELIQTAMGYGCKNTTKIYQNKIYQRVD